MARKDCTDTGKTSIPPGAHQAPARGRVRLPRKKSAPGSHTAVRITGSARAEDPAMVTDRPGPAGGEGNPLSHVDAGGTARMVDVGGKEPTRRRARASARVRMLPATLALIRGGAAAKGDVLAAARIAGIMAAKETWRLIPLCHPVALDRVALDFAFEGDDRLAISAEAAATARTGVEMEALAAAAVAALTVYDMIKGVERGVEIRALRLVSKSGGRSGAWERPAPGPAKGPARPRAARGSSRPVPRRRT
jgi:cyclic pyranopterin phosphate synthase